MLAARQHYEQLGYSLEDTSLTRPYDYVATRGDERRRIEVKGSQSDGQSVMLTGNEVEAAKAGPEPTDLFVLSQIAVGIMDGNPVPSGGTMRLIADWRPSAKDLTPTEYRYVVPSADD
jgi:hypothetical protein